MVRAIGYIGSITGSKNSGADQCLQEKRRRIYLCVPSCLEVIFRIFGKACRDHAMVNEKWKPSLADCE